MTLSLKINKVLSEFELPKCKYDCPFFLQCKIVRYFNNKINNSRKKIFR